MNIAVKLILGLEQAQEIYIQNLICLDAVKLLKTQNWNGTPSQAQPRRCSRGAGTRGSKSAVDKHNSLNKQARNAPHAERKQFVSTVFSSKAQKTDTRQNAQQ